MSHESNTPDVLELLNTTELPVMRVDSATVLAGGRQRVRRHRVQMLAVAIATILALAPGGWLLAHSVDRGTPVPSEKTHQLTTGLFAKTDGVGNLGHGRVSLYGNSGNGADTPVKTTYQVTRSRGALRVARVDRGTTVDLHQTGAAAGGIFQSVDRRRGVLALEVPPDATMVTVLAAGDDDANYQSVASYLPDGTAVALIQSSTSFRKPVEAVIWQRADGVIGASTGETPATVTQDRDTFYYFNKLGAFGVISASGGSGLIRSRGIDFGTGVEGTPNDENFIIAGLFPRGVSHVRLTPAMKGANIAVTHLPNSKWDLVTARYRASANAKSPIVLSSVGRWDPSNGEPPATGTGN
jgi:hypothetical protein